MLSLIQQIKSAAESEAMKALLLAIFITLSTGCALFFLLSHIGADKSVSSAIASSSLAFFTIVHDNVSKALSAKNASSLTPGIVPISRYGLNPWLMLLYAVLTTVGCVELGSALFIIPMTILNANGGRDSIIGTTTVATIPVLAFTLYLVGRWVGIRTAKKGYWILPAAFLLGRSLDIAITYRFAPESRSTLRSTFTRPGIYGATGMLIVLTGIGVIGVWRGNRIRWGVYLNSLLRQVSTSTRDTLMAMSFEEANANPKPDAIAPLRS